MARHLGLLAPGTPPGYVQAFLNLLRDAEMDPLSRAMAVRVLADAARDGLPIRAVLAPEVPPCRIDARRFGEDRERI